MKRIKLNQQANFTTSQWLILLNVMLFKLYRKTIETQCSKHILTTTQDHTNNRDP